MPQVNGFELMRQIKRVDKSAKISLLTALVELSEYAMDIKKIGPTLNKNCIIKKQSKIQLY
jgi:CheY-like chemotaxis protein